MLNIIGGRETAARTHRAGLTKTTTSLKTAEVKHRWFVIDAENLVLGRLASAVATLLQGKDRPDYTPHVNSGAHVIVVNAEKIALTGKKIHQKRYYRHTGYIGGIKETPVKAVLEGRFPERVIANAVRGMMKDGPLAEEQFGRLRVYKGPEHLHIAQSPVPLDITLINSKNYISNERRDDMAKNLGQSITDLEKSVSSLDTAVSSLGTKIGSVTTGLSDVKIEVSGLANRLASYDEVAQAEREDNRRFRAASEEFQNQAIKDLADLPKIREHTARMADLLEKLAAKLDPQ